MENEEWRFKNKLVITDYNLESRIPTSLRHLLELRIILTGKDPE